MLTLKQELLPQSKIHHGQKHSIPNINPLSNMKYLEIRKLVRNSIKHQIKILKLNVQEKKNNNNQTFQTYMYTHTGDRRRARPRDRRRGCEEVFAQKGEVGEEAKEVEHGDQAQHPGHQYEADHERDGPAEHERERRAEQQRRDPRRRHLRQPRRPPGRRRSARDIDDVVDESGELLHDPSLVAHHDFFHLPPIQHHPERERKL